MSAYKEMLKDVMQVVKWGNALPTGPERDLCSSYPLFGKLVKKHEEKITELINKLLKSQSLVAKVTPGADIDAQNEYLSDCIDNIMEKVGLSLDDAAGLKKSVLVVNASVEHVLTRKTNTPLKNGSQFRLTTAKLVTRPQIHFKINNKNEPFVPKITEKPNSLRPLAILYEPNEMAGQYCHPYEFELEKFKPAEEFLHTRTPVEPKSLEATDLVLVDGEAKLKVMMADLEKQKEIAVDLEHHNYRSYLGLTCLLQISSRTVDYIVDTLALWDKLQCLNSVFTNPNILKVMHGADSDIEWLQRDLGVYVVNLFDTHQAAKYLEMSRKSLAHLLDRYLHIYVDKTYQLADWRIRPLPEEMVKYAREDTHYLLYVYDKMRNELSEKTNGKNLLHGVFESSRQVCLKRYEKPRTHEESHLDLYWKSKKMFDARQMAALKDLYLWRDKVAREEDESTAFVLPNHQLLQISEHLPREMQGLLACCNPVPILVKQHLHILHQIVLKARDVRLEVTANVQHVATQLQLPTSAMRDMAEDKLTCVHDFSHCDPHQDVATLLNDDLVQALLATHKTQPVIRLKAKSDLVFSSKTKAKEQGSESPFSKSFVTPYLRYVKYTEMRAEAKAKEAKEKSAAQTAVQKPQNTDEEIKERLNQVYLSLSSTSSGTVVARREKPPSNQTPTSSTVPKPAGDVAQDSLILPTFGTLKHLITQVKTKKNKDSELPISVGDSKGKGKKRKSEEPEKAEGGKKLKEEKEKATPAFSYADADFSAFDEKIKRKPDFVKDRRDKKHPHIQRHGANSVTYTKKK